MLSGRDCSRLSGTASGRGELGFRITSRVDGDALLSFLPLKTKVKRVSSCLGLFPGLCVSQFIMSLSSRANR